MPASEPAWWYGAPDSRPARWLRPVSRLYGAIVERRMLSATPYTASQPVICIGNFTAGGTGKTPLTQSIVAMLLEAGGTPAILSRGYGGKLKGPHWVEPSHDRAADVGDEPLLLVTRAPVMIARDRAAGARAIEADGRGITHIVMDDGLQNPALAKSLTLAVVDGARGLGNGDVIPAGPLRAGLAFQMGRVDAIVVNTGYAARGQTNAVTADLARMFSGPEFAGPVLEASIAPQLDTASLGGKPVIAFAGIGVPERFFQMLRDLGVNLGETIAFKDHHVFSQKDAERLLEVAKRRGALLLTTEKDYARLAGLTGACAELRAQAKPVPIRMAFSPHDRMRLDALLAPLLPR